MYDSTLVDMVNLIWIFDLFQEEKLPYAFYVSDHELVVQLGSYLQKNKG